MTRLPSLKRWRRQQAPGSKRRPRTGSRITTLPRALEFAIFATVGFVVAGLLSSPSYAQAAPTSPNTSPNTSTAVNNQLQWGDVFATMTVDVRGQAGAASPGGVASSATAAGNTASAANLAGNLNLRSRQTMSGATGASATIAAGDACCYAVTAATAQANAIEAQSAAGDLGATITQLADGGDVTADAAVNLGASQRISAGATAAANNTALSATRGDITASVTQASQVAIAARIDYDACCSGEGNAAAAASANTLSATGATTTMDVALDQRSTGASVTAAADLYQVRGYVATGVASASGNSATIANEYGFARVTGGQVNASAIGADARVELGSWDEWALSSAYGVGNAALVTNIGSDVQVDLTQDNAGEVNASASLAGGGLATGANGEAILSSAAIGNAFTGYVCSYCGESSVSGTLTQANSGAVHATGTITTSGATGLIGSASAIGNAATYITTTRRD